jgi:tripartite-type tricarboxylate transporter receptor subunit TctC
VNVIVGYPPKGGYALYARLLSNHLAKHIPGTPQLTLQFMPGAGSTRAANYLSSVAPKNGTTLAVLGQEVAHFQVMQGSVKYDAAKFIPIGRMVAMNSAVVVWHSAPARSLAEAKEKELLFGATGASSQSYTNVIVMRNLLGYKFRPIQGYPGGAEINLAMERGEVHARIGSWDAFKAEAGGHLAAKRMIPLAEIGLESSPDLKVPLVLDLATKTEDRRIIQFLSSSASVGRSIYLPPGVPADRVAALRQAFDAMMRSREFIEAAKKTKSDLEYMSGANVEKILKETVATPKDLIDSVNAALKP